MRTSGAARSTSGRLPTLSRKRSHTASFTFSVANSRLFSGLFCAVTLTLMLFWTEKYFGQASARAASYRSFSFR